VNVTRRALIRTTGLGGGIAGVFGAAACAVGGSGGDGTAKQALAPATVNFLNWNAANEMANLFQAHLFDAVKKDLPQLTINVIGVPQGEAAAKLITLAAGGSAPDVALLRPQDISSVYAQKILAELDPLLKRDAKDVQLDDFFPAAVQRGVKNGKNYALPFQMAISVPQYNKGLFSSAGLKPPDDTWTWDTYLDAARRLTKREEGVAPIIGTTAGDYQVFVWSWGGEILDPTQTKFVMDEDKATAALQFWADLKAKHQVVALPSDPVLGNGNEQNRFAIGQLGMYCGGYTIAQMEVLPNVPPWDCFLMPKGPSNKRVTLSGGPSISMMTDSKVKDGAWAWMKYYVGPEIQRFAAVDTKQPVARKSALEAQMKLPATFNRRLQLDSAAFAREMPYVVQYDAFNKIITDALATVTSGQKSAPQAMREIKPQVDTLLAQR